MSRSFRIGIMLDLAWPYKRHASVFAGSQQYAEEQGWESIIDEFTHDTLPAKRGQDGHQRPQSVFGRVTKDQGHQGQAAGGRRRAGCRRHLDETITAATRRRIGHPGKARLRTAGGYRNGNLGVQR